MTDVLHGTRTESRRAKARRAFGGLPVSVAVSIGWLMAMIVVALLADTLSPDDYRALDLRDRLAPPLFLGGGVDHALGTDELGRDVLSRLLVSIRISLTVAFLATLLSTLIGVTIGFLAAHFRGWFEQLVLMLIDLQAALPFMFLALFVLAFFGNSLPLFTILVGFYGWERTARLARGLALAADGQTYIAAVRQIGASPWRVYLVHVLPNTASTLVVAMTLNFPEIILLESGLSFLGIGVQPPLTSLGNMVGYGRQYLSSAAWIPLAPSAVIVLTTLSVSIVGDWLRDRLNPERR